MLNCLSWKSFVKKSYQKEELNTEKFISQGYYDQKELTVKKYYFGTLPGLYMLIQKC